MKQGLRYYSVLSTFLDVGLELNMFVGASYVIHIHPVPCKIRKSAHFLNIIDHLNPSYLIISVPFLAIGL